MPCKFSITLTLSFVFAVLGCQTKQEVVIPNPYLLNDGQRPLVIAHGGAKDLFPENTLVAFDGSRDLAADVLEMDVCMTKDEILVCHHDLTIDATSDGSGPLIEFTLSQLLEYNFGYDFTDTLGQQPYRDEAVAIPTLEEVFLRYPNQSFVAEIKNRGENGKRAAEVMKNIIERTQVEDRVVVVSFSSEVLDYFVEITKGKILVSAAEEEVKDFVFSGLSAMEFLYRPEAAMLQIPRSSAGIRLDTRRLIQSAHRRRMAVHYWTIDDPEEMHRLLDLGADGLITDRPDLMWKVLRARGF